MVKILHTADIHLDSPFSLKNTESAQLMRQTLRATFTSCVLYARTQNIDIVLISGDVFDTGYASRETMNLLKSEFEKNPGIRFVISPGNHDPYTQSSPWAKTDFPDNVYIFRSSSLHKFSFDDINTDVYGWAFTSDTMTVDPLAVRPALDGKRINILCAHCEIDGPAGGKYCTIGKAELEAAGFDYAALGHIHKGSEQVQRVGRTFFAYPGCLEGRSFDECGQKHALVGEIRKEHGFAAVDIAPRPFTQRRFEIIEVDVTGAETVPQMISIIDAEMKKARIDSEVSLRVVLRGRVPVSLVISEQFLKSGLGGARYMEIADKTEPLAEPERYEDDPGIRGEFFRSMKPLLTQEDEHGRMIAAKALRAALDALGGRK